MEKGECESIIALVASQPDGTAEQATLSKPFKYVVTCNLVQKAGAGMHTATTVLWDDKTDGKHTVSIEKPTMLCVCTVYWCAI